MSGKQRGCAICGVRWPDELIFHRFPKPGPQGSLRSRIWAMHFFPKQDWSTNESLDKLYASHKLVCGRHFDGSSYTDSSRRRLNLFAIPVNSQHIMRALQENQEVQTENNAPEKKSDTPQMRCCVPGCKVHEKPLHNFPRGNKLVIDEWKRRIHLPVLNDLDFNELYNRFYVCSDHFCLENFLPNSKHLFHCSVPTIRLPGFQEEPTLKNMFFFPKYESDYKLGKRKSCQPEEVNKRRKHSLNEESDTIYDDHWVDDDSNDSTGRNDDCEEMESLKNALENVSSTITLPFWNYRGEQKDLTLDYTRGIKLGNYEVYDNDDLYPTIQENVTSNDELQYSKKDKGCQTEDRYIQDRTKTKQEYDIFNKTLVFHDYLHVIIEKICRLCGQPGYPPMLDIFSEKENIKHKITVLYPALNFYHVDGLPQHICNKCYSHIQAAFDFYENTINCERSLRTLLNVDVPTIIDKCHWSDTVPFNLYNYTNSNDNALFNPYKKDDKKLYVQFIIEPLGDQYCCPFCDYEALNKDMIKDHFKNRHLKNSIERKQVKGFPSTIKKRRDKTPLQNKTPNDTDNIVIETEPSNKEEENLPEDVTQNPSQPTDNQEADYENIQVEDLLKNNKTEEMIVHKGIFASSICGQKFDNSNDKTEHESGHSISSYVCSECTKLLPTEDSVKEHMEAVHRGVKQHQCIEMSLKVIYECEYCTERYISPLRLRAHREICKMALDDNYRCHCPQTFDDIVPFYAHMQFDDCCFNQELQKPTCVVRQICKFCDKDVLDWCKHMHNMHTWLTNLATEYLQKQILQLQIKKEKDVS